MTKTKTKTKTLSAAEIVAMRDACFAGLAQRLKGGMQNPRIVRMQSERSGVAIDEATAQFLASQGVTREALALILSPSVNPSKPLRFGQFANALRTGQLSHVDAGSARGLLALREAPAHTLNTDALQDATMGKQAPKGLDCANLRGVSLSRLNALCPQRVGAGTAPAFVSRSFGRGGFFEMLGAVTVKGARNAEITLNEEPGGLVRAFFAAIDGASDRELSILGSATKGASEE